MQNIPEVNNTTQINSAEFVKITIFNHYPANTTANIFIGNSYIISTSGNTNWTALGATANSIGTYFTATANGSVGTGTANDVSVLTFSSSYKDETISGNVYYALGGLLAVGSQNRNLRVTSGDTTVSLSGIDGNNIFNVLATKIRGSEMQISRGFYNNNSVLGNVYNRFTGIITSYAISEDREGTEDNFTVSVAASSYKTVLENRIAGRKTNQESWQFFNSTDVSMNQVYSISGVAFDFGQDPKGKVVVPGKGGYPGGFPPGFDPTRGLNQN